MKHTMTVLTLVVASLFVLGLVRQDQAGLVPAVQAEGECSVATLQGDYLLTGTADFAPRGTEDATTYPRIQVGVHTFDGKGEISGVVTQIQGGDIVRQTPMGTYTLDSDCRGTLTFPMAQANWEIVVTRDGQEGEYIRVDQGHIARRSIRKQ